PQNKRVRYVLYSQTQMNRILAQARTAWPEMGVIAHEIGHHLTNDDFKNATGQERRNIELAADREAGKLLRRMNATLDEALMGWNLLDTKESTDYPGRADRRAAVTSGWKDADESIDKENPSSRSWGEYQVITEIDGTEG